MKRTKTYPQLINQTLKFLSYRPRSQQEVNLFLKRKGASSIDIKKVIAYFQEIKLINDKDFVLWWQQNRDRFRPRSFKLLRLELLQKGVNRQLILNTLDSSSLKELMRAQKAFKQKFKNKLPNSDPKQQQKIYRFLSSRGFSYSIIKQVTKDL